MNQYEALIDRKDVAAPDVQSKIKRIGLDLKDIIQNMEVKVWKFLVYFERPIYLTSYFQGDQIGIMRSIVLNSKPPAPAVTGNSTGAYLSTSKPMSPHSRPSSRYEKHDRDLSPTRRAESPHTLNTKMSSLSLLKSSMKIQDSLKKEEERRGLAPTE